MHDAAALCLAIVALSAALRKHSSDHPGSAFAWAFPATPRRSGRWARGMFWSSMCRGAPGSAEVRLLCRRSEGALVSPQKRHAIQAKVTERQARDFAGTNLYRP